MNKKRLLNPVRYIAGCTLAMFLFFECVSILNQQWEVGLSHLSCPTDFLIDVLSGHWIPSLVSVLISLILSGVISCWFKGGLARIVSQHILYGIFCLVLALVSTAVLVNSWMSSSIDTLNQLVDVMNHLTPHTKAYSRFWLCVVLGSMVLVCLLFYPMYHHLRRDNKVLGNAHFASGLETYQSGMLQVQDESILIGKKYGKPLFSNGFEHVLVFAPSGSGKTRSIAIPNLFHFPYSVVCNDVKFTLFDTTSGYRKTVLGHDCYCFAPTRKSGITHRYNPLMFISKNSLERMTDIQQIAHIFMPDNPKEQVIWTQASRKLFKTLVLYLLDTPGSLLSFGTLNRLVKQEDFDGWLSDVLDTTEHLDPEFYRNGYSYLNNHEKTRQGILETFSGYLELFDDPVVDAATSDSDFNLTELRKRKMTVYVGFTDEDMERLAPLLTLFWQQLMSCMIRELPDVKKEPYPLLCLIDEFSSLGRIERLRRSLKLLREYRVRCVLMFQYIAQTYEKYSHDEAKAFINIKTKVAYTTEDMNDAEFISKMLGTRTKKVTSYSVTNQQQGMSTGSNAGYQAIPLMRPDELMKMSSRISLIMRAGDSPVKAQQYIWYREAPMNEWEMPACDVPKQHIKIMPFIRQKAKKGALHKESFNYLD